MGVPVADLQAAADRLVKAGPDLFMAWGPAAARAAQHATTSIPIVALADDLVESGLVASMSRPGGNTTGVGILASQLDAKRLDVLTARVSWPSLASLNPQACRSMCECTRKVNFAARPALATMR